MPGATPYQAVEAFLAPIERALGCLGSVKVTTSPGGRGDIGRSHNWMLNRGSGMELHGEAGGRFLATMHYRIVETDPEKYDISAGRWRVTTSAYLYEYRDRDGRKVWAMHWHPTGTSHATYPHVHLYTVNPDGHFVTSRQTVEEAVQWCIQMGAEPQNPDWATLLMETEGIHKLYRSWTDVPPALLDRP